MISCRIRPLVDSDGQELNRVAFELRVLSTTAVAHGHVAELLEPAARPSYLDPEAEWVEERDLAQPFVAELVLTLDGPRGTAYEGARLRVHLSFPPSYPSAPPLVRMGSQLHHPQVDEGGLLEGPFYRALGWERKPSRNVRSVVALVHELLRSPLPSGSQLPKAARLRLASLQRLRVQTIQRYTPLRAHPVLFAQPPQLGPDWIEPALLAACDARDEGAMRRCLTELSPGVFTFPLATALFCRLMLDELDAFEASGLPASRPNSMNRCANNPIPNPT
jgi:ubiquitin-protein ligase